MIKKIFTETKNMYCLIVDVLVVIPLFRLTDNERRTVFIVFP